MCVICHVSHGEIKKTEKNIIMKNMIRTAAVVFSVVLMLSAVVLPASAQVPYDSLIQYGQLTIEATASPDIQVDGVVTPGEYTSEPIVLDHKSIGMQLLNWSNSNKPISDEDLLEVLPKKVTYYISYDAEGLHLAAEVVEANFYNTCGAQFVHACVCGKFRTRIFLPTALMPSGPYNSFICIKHEKNMSKALTAAEIGGIMVKMIPDNSPRIHESEYTVFYIHFVYIF